MREWRVMMSEEEKQVHQEIGKQRMHLKRPSLNTEQNQEFCKKERQRRHTKWASLKPEEQEAQHQRRREREHERWASFISEEKEAYCKRHRRRNCNYRSREAEKKGVPLRVKRPVDIMSILRKPNAQLLVAEEAEPLPFASREHVNVPLTSGTSSQCNDPLLEERTQSSTNSVQPSTEQQLQVTENSECDNEQVAENMSLAGTASAHHEQTTQHDTVVGDQTCTRVVAVGDEVRWQFKDHYCASTTLQLVGQC